MARGWESKAVEEQAEMAEMAEAAQLRINAEQNALSSEAVERIRKVEGLRLTRSNLLEQLSKARTVAHRQILHQALRELDEQLAALT